MISKNVQYIIDQEWCGLCADGSYFHPENQKFFPFFVFTNWEVSRNNPVYCDYCANLIIGNGNYSSDYFVFENSETVKIVCSKACMGDGVWCFHDQKHGQPKPLLLPQPCMPEHELVYHHFVWAVRYEILNHNGFKSWSDLAKVIKTNWGGGSYKDGLCCLYESGRLFTYSYDGDKVKKHIDLSQTDILRIVNELLFSNKYKQLTLF